MEIPRPYTHLETVDIMIVEAQNQLTKCEILDRHYQRAILKGGNQQVKLLMGQNQSQIRNIKETLVNMEDIRKDYLK